MLGLQFTREVEFNKHLIFDFLDVHYGLGVSCVETDQRKPNSDDDDDDDDEFYSVETAHLSIGISLRKKVGKKQSLGLYAQYNYTPQRLFSENVEEGFGNSSLTTGLAYRF